MTEISVKITGGEALRKMLEQFPEELATAITAAGEESSKEVMETTGIRKYPVEQYPRPAMPMTDRQRRGFFARLRAGEIDVPYVRGGRNSKEFGRQFYTTQQHYTTIVGNNAPYADYLIGSGQAAYMASIGWRKLDEVAIEKTDKIIKIYAGWVKRAIKQAGLA